MREQARRGRGGRRLGELFQQVARAGIDRLLRLQTQRQLVRFQQRGVLAQLEHDAGEIVRALRRVGALRGQPLRRRLRPHGAVGVAQRQPARAHRGLGLPRGEQGRFQQRPQRRQVGVLVLHAGQREQIVAAEVAQVFEADAQRAHQPVGGGGAGLAAADQLDLQLGGEFVGGLRIDQQAERQQPHRAAGVRRRGLQHRRRHHAVVAAEGDHVLQRAARQPARQVVQRGPHREAGAQQFHLVEQRAGQRQSCPGDLRHQAEQVGRHVLGQFGGRIAGQRGRRRRLSGHRFEGQQHRQGVQCLRFHDGSILQRENMHSTAAPRATCRTVLNKPPRPRPSGLSSGGMAG